MKAKKSLGQHFLRSGKALNKIIEVGRIVPGETVLEIGPGEGALMRKLLEAGARVIAIEKDDGLYEQLKRENLENLELIHADILKFDLALVDVSYKLIANIPYNITGAILEKFLSAENQPGLAVLLVQKEVAKRIVDKKGSVLSISIQAYGKPRYVETVKAGSFAPTPKVDSAIIAIENISKDLFKEFSEEKFFKMLKTGFKSKRKKLSSNLASAFGKEKVSEAFQKLKISDNTRAEELDLATWAQIAREILWYN